MIYRLKDFDMAVTRMILQGGVELNLVEKQWRVASSEPPELVTFPSVDDALNHLQRHIICITEDLGRGNRFTSLLRIGTLSRFNLAVSEIMQTLEPVEYLMPIQRIGYLLGALSYHCQNLAELYVVITSRQAALSQVRGHKSSDSRIFGHQEEAYYEFDAFVSVARRTYDSLRVPLWQRYGKGKGSRPSSLENLLKQDLPMPSDLHHRLNRSWEEAGRRLTEYRDCIHHYIPVDLPLSYAIVEKTLSHIWTARVMIPDNPEARSSKQFTYTRNLDALDYSFSMSDELLQLSIDVVDSIIQRSDAV